jgi:hypothetical protein
MFGLGPSPRARAKPHVLFDTRSVNGRLLVAPHALAMAAMYVEQDLGGKFFSHQMRGYGRVFADWVRLYTRMDIIVATYGSALVLGNMMPPGAASVMLSWPYAGGHRYPRGPGVGLPCRLSVGPDPLGELPRGV